MAKIINGLPYWLFSSQTLLAIGCAEGVAESVYSTVFEEGRGKYDRRDCSARDVHRLNANTSRYTRWVSPHSFKRNRWNYLAFPICAFAWKLFWGRVGYLVKLLNRVYSKQNLFGSVFVPLHRCIFAALRFNRGFTIGAQRVTLLEHICSKQVQPLYVTNPSSFLLCFTVFCCVMHQCSTEGTCSFTLQQGYFGQLSVSVPL